MTQSQTTMSSQSEARAALEIHEIKPGLRFTVPVLRMILPDVETALFFGKVYDLTFRQLSHLIDLVFETDLVKELQRGDHSTSLQGYLLEPGWLPEAVTKGSITLKPNVPHGEILPELWRSMEVQVAQSIKDVAKKLALVVGHMPGKQGSMVFKSMMKLNVKRPTIGTYQAAVHHAPQKDNLVILDVSGSMTRGTIERIIEDVVALSYLANAHLAVVSNTTTTWEPGTFEVRNVLAACEFGGTRYETLAPLLDKDWGVVVTIADYDSSQSAADAIRRRSRGRIDKLLDLSLVNRPTFLSECVGQLADEVQPLLIAQSHRVLSS